MKVNSRVFTERTDLLGEIKIPTCPNQFKGIAEQLIMMVTKPGYSVPDYHNVTHLDKLLTLDYWMEYEGLGQALTEGNFNRWFILSATPEDLISRTLRWLISHNYIFVKPEIQERAMEASNKWRQSISHK